MIIEDFGRHFLLPPDGGVQLPGCPIPSFPEIIRASSEKRVLPGR